MKKYKKIFISTGLIVFVVVISAVAFPFLPVLLVNDQYVSYGDYKKIAGALEYFEETSGQKISPTDDYAHDSLMSLVDQTVLNRIALAINSNIESETDITLDQAINNVEGFDLDKVARELYGMKASDYRRLFLVPQTKRDIVLGMYVGGDNPEDLQKLWDEEFSKVEVRVYHPQFEWTGEVIKRK
jgi:hypothetical protein